MLSDMVPEVVKYRLWALALRMNPQICTYKTRSISTTPGGTDAFVSYKLTRVVYQPLNNQEKAYIAGNATLSGVTKKWIITQVDLEQAQPLMPTEKPVPAPSPQIGYELSFADGTLWVVREINPGQMNQAFECLCSEGRPQ